MSKKSTIQCKIKEADSRIMRKAIEHIAEQYDGRIRIMDKDHLSLYSPNLGNIDIRVENGQLNVSGFEEQTKVTATIVEDYYNATMIAEEFNAPFEVDAEKNPELMIEV